ncbi:hypothetical protein Tco_0222204 [Tanacetum coccineum]
MANTTPIVTTVTKAATKEKTPKEADAAPRVNILNFYEEHYEDILSVIMDKIRRDKRKEVHTRLDFGQSYKKSRRMREGSQNSSAGTLPARYRNPSERPKMWDRLRSNDGNVFTRLGHRWQSVFERLTKLTRQAQISPGQTGQTLGIIHTVEVILTYRTLLLAKIVLEAETAPAASKNHMVIPALPTGQGPDIDITLVTGTATQKKYVKDLVEIHNIKQGDGETIEDFIERFKVETGRMKRAPECM